MTHVGNTSVCAGLRTMESEVVTGVERARILKRMSEFDLELEMKKISIGDKKSRGVVLG